MKRTLPAMPANIKPEWYAEWIGHFWPPDAAALWHERAAIMEIEGHKPRWQAEREAEADIRKLEMEEGT